MSDGYVTLHTATGLAGAWLALTAYPSVLRELKLQELMPELALVAYIVAQVEVI